MRRLMVMAVTSLALFGCAASQYKFTCTSGVCEVETAGPATIDFEQEFGATLEVVETKDDRVTMRTGSTSKTFAAGDREALGPMQVWVKNVKGENAYFNVQR